MPNAAAARTAASRTLGWASRHDTAIRVRSALSSPSFSSSWHAHRRIVGSWCTSSTRAASTRSTAFARVMRASADDRSSGFVAAVIIAFTSGGSLTATRFFPRASRSTSAASSHLPSKSTSPFLRRASVTVSQRSPTLSYPRARRAAGWSGSIASTAAYSSRARSGSPCASQASASRKCPAASSLPSAARAFSAAARGPSPATTETTSAAASRTSPAGVATDTRAVLRRG